MANQELINKDPFERIGSFVYGPRFIGRKKQIRSLQEHCVSRNLLIHGMPKSGKTSLVYNCLVANKNQIQSPDGNEVFTVFIQISSCESSNDVFKTIFEKTIDALGKANLNENNKEFLEKETIKVSKKKFARKKIGSFFEQCISKLPVNIIIILTKFDKIRHLFSHGYQFATLSTIFCAEHVHGIIVSRRSLEAIEKLAIDQDGSTFFQVFDGGADIVLGQYEYDDNTHNDIKEYWDYLSPYYEKIGFPIDDNYKKNAEFYAYHHPYLLDVYNDTHYQTYRCAKTQPDMKAIRIAMYKAFDEQINILEEENLFQAAQQAILGPVYNLNQAQIDILVNNGYIRKTTPECKEKLMGINAGFVGIDIDSDTKKEIAYIAPSDYFTLLFKRRFYEQLDFWNEWKITFKALRKIGIKFLFDNYGPNWEDCDSEPIIKAMRKLRQKDIDSNIDPSPLSGYLTETHMSTLLSNYWSSFRVVFPNLGEKTLEMFSQVTKIRNHHAHLNDEFLSDEKKEEANNNLIALQEEINKWYESNNSSEKLLIINESETDKTLPLLPYQGIMEFDPKCSPFGAYHVGPFFVSNILGKKSLGKTVTILNAKPNNNFSTKDSYPFFADGKNIKE